MLECLANILIAFYFRAVTFIFWLVNSLKEKKVVSHPKDPLILKSATQLGQEIRSRKIKSIDVVEAYIKRIDEVNNILNAVTYKRFELARKQAKQIDAEIAGMDDNELTKCAETRPLLGLTFTIKDSMSVKGQIITSALYERKDTVCEDTAPVVQRMLDAGAILLAVTTVPENCMWMEAGTPLWGRSSNPYDSRRIVGGSSGGEGALNGAGASLMGLGSDIAGSIRIPSFMNGVFGFMGTPGNVPLDGHIPAASADNYWDEMARIGPITRFSEDLPMLYNILQDKKPSDEKKLTSLENVRLFFAEGLTHFKLMEPLSKETKHSMYSAVSHFEKKFDKIAQAIALPETSDVYDMYLASFMDEPKNGKPKDELLPIMTILIELMKSIFGLSNHSVAFLLFNIGIPRNGIPKETSEKFTGLRDKLKRRFSELLGDDGILLFPSWPTLPPFHNEPLAKHTSLMHTGLFNILGMPAVQCPIGLTNGLPNGVMIVANKGCDHLCLKAAQEITTAFGGWAPPGDN